MRAADGEDNSWLGDLRGAKPLVAIPTCELLLSGPLPLTGAIGLAAIMR